MVFQGEFTFAFGLGGPLANFAGLLHMTMHSLTKSAIFFSVGQITQVKKTQNIDDIRGLTVSHPVLGWGLVLGVVAIVVMLKAPKGIWGLVRARYDLRLFPLGYRVIPINKAKED